MVHNAVFEFQEANTGQLPFSIIFLLLSLAPHPFSLISQLSKSGPLRTA